MTARPLVSVVLPVYNRAGTVAHAIESVLSQTAADLELIVVDDGSTDGTWTAMSRYGGRARLLRHPTNRGAYAARNLAVSAARGEVIAFIDSDDRWANDKLQRQLRCLRSRTGVGLVFGDGVFTRGDGSVDLSRRRFFETTAPRRGHAFDALLMRNFIPQSSVIVRAEVLRDTGPFLEVPLAADYHKWLQIARRFEIDHVDGATFFYGVDGSNVSRDIIRARQALVSVYRELASEEGDATVLARINRRIELAEAELAVSEVSSGEPRLINALLARHTVSRLRRLDCVCRAAVRRLGRSLRSVLMERVRA